jgi:cysteinyl-tRNA synthetase
VIDAEAIVKSLGVLAATGWGASLFGWFLYGTVRPRVRRLVRISKHYRERLKAADAMILEGAKKIRALENTCIAFEKELKRVDRIREKCEDYATEARKENERLRRWSDRHQDRRAA